MYLYVFNQQNLHLYQTDTFSLPMPRPGVALLWRFERLHVLGVQHLLILLVSQATFYGAPEYSVFQSSARRRKELTLVTR